MFTSQSIVPRRHMELYFFFFLFILKTHQPSKVVKDLKKKQKQSDVQG